MNKKLIHSKLGLAVFLLLFSGFLFQPKDVKAASKLIELLFNEGSGTVVHDSSGLGNNANITGATWTQLPTGKWVLSFNGSGNRIYCNSSPSYNINGTGARLTLEAWVNIAQSKSAMWMGTGSGGGTDGGYALYYHQPISKVAGYIEGVGGATSSSYGWHATVYESTPLETNHWYHVVYTYDGQYGKVYLNGVEDTLNEGSPAWTGGIFSGSSNPFQVYSGFAGMFGKIAVYDYTLSPAQIQSNYQAEIGNYYQVSINPTIYVYPAITDNKVLPNTALSNQYISNNISVSGSPGEYRPASFVIYTPVDASSVTITASSLMGSSGTIDSSAVDIRSVKVWYQAGSDDVWVGDNKPKILTPELLLKDDSLVTIQGQENYLKLTSGAYTWISETRVAAGNDLIPVTTMPVQDSANLLPVKIPAMTNKQFWITIKIPANAIAGTYSGTIQLNSSAGQIGTLQMGLTVLPIQLLNPILDYSIYYRAQLNSNWPQGTISSEFKSEAQMSVELENMYNHGVTNPQVYQDYTGSNTLLGRVLALRNSAGITGPLFYLGLNHGYFGANLTNLKNYVTNMLSFISSYGVHDFYIYGHDEQGITATDRSQIAAINEAGGKVFNAQSPSQADSAADILDLAVVALTPNSTLAAKYHSYGNKIYSYANPQVGLEKPETYRRNFGLLLWQKDYDGAADYAYQDGGGNVWNDFDGNRYRDSNFTYPTINGVIDTIEWEGFREGVNDVKYLSTLLNTITTAKVSGINTSAAETWVANLKNLNLAAANLDTVRSDMISQILALQGQTPSCASCNLGTPIINPTSPLANQSFTMTCPANAAGYDCIDAYANGSSNKCTFSSYSGNNAVYSCTGLTTGTYTSRCEAKTGTSRNCCASSQSGSYTVQAAPDTTAPSQVTNLNTSNITQTSITLGWTSPGDDGSSGTATSYDIRYSTASITSSNWTSATAVSGEPAPLTSGTSQTLTVSGLTANTTYYFAIKAIDDANNISLLSNVVSGKILASTTADTTPPTRSSSQPTGTLAAGTTQATISLSTNESATCKYGTVSGTAYASMTGTFTTTGGSSHSKTVTGITNGSSYTYYVRCIDSSNNANANDFAISFSVSSPSCIDCGLGTPIINPTSPLTSETFTMTCPTNASGYDCIDAYANGSSNKCTFSSYSGNNALYTCTGLTAGTYTSRCEAKTGTSRNCCANVKTGSYTILDPYIPPVTPPPTAGGDEPTVTPTSTTPANIAQLQALIQQLLAQVAQLQAQLSAAQGVPSQFRFNNPLYLGLRNDDVKQLQIFLTGQGTAIYPEAKITGYYGLLTRKAVIRFQLKYNIIASEYSAGAGLVGIKTRLKINTIMGK